MRLQLTMSKFRSRSVSILLALAALAVTAGCRRDMQDQPKIKALRGSTFFADGLGSRQPIEGTIPRGFLRDDNPEFYTGKKSGAATASATPAQQQTAGAQNSPQQNTFPDDVVEFPIPVTKEVVERGKSRY